MTPVGSRHAAAVARATRALVLAAGTQATVRVQSPIRSDGFTEPEPDLVLVRPRDDFYSAEHPRAADVLLVIEIADSLLSYDREMKARLYARAGIAEYWLSDLSGRTVTAYSAPQDGGRAWMLRTVEVVPRAHENEVGFRLGEVVRPDRALHAYDRLCSRRQHQGASRTRDRRGMARADRRHPQNLAGDELDAVVLGENSGVGHAVILGDGEPSLLAVDRHATQDNVIRGHVGRLVPDDAATLSPISRSLECAGIAEEAVAALQILLRPKRLAVSVSVTGRLRASRVQGGRRHDAVAICSLVCVLGSIGLAAPAGAQAPRVSAGAR
jgi:Uma2 family endonuclease